MQRYFVKDSRLAFTHDGGDEDAEKIIASGMMECDGPPPTQDHRWDGAKWVLDITAAKTAKWEAIKAERDRRTDQGGYKVGTKWFHSGQKPRSQQLGLVLLGANIPAGLQWKTMDGSFVTMTATLAQQILAAGAASDQAIFAAAEAHKAAMEANADPASYDFSAGWPAMFGGGE